MMTTFCKWCNSEAKHRCDLCTAPCCQFHRSYELGYHHALETSSELYGFICMVLRFFSDPENPTGKLCEDKNRGGALTFKNFYENVYLAIDFKKFPKKICKYCEDKISQVVKEMLFPVLQIVKDSGLICSYH